MIDLHAHILSGVDDGADTIEESLEMCRIASRDGIRTIVATPHTLNGLYQNDRSSILTKVHHLNTALSQFRNAKSKIRIPKFEIEILPGADVHLNDQTIPQLDGGKVATIGDKGKCLLLEFPFTGIPYGAEEVLHQLISRRVIPLISHPERNLEVEQDPKRYYQMIRMGCLGQVTAMSLTDGFGRDVGRLSKMLLKAGLVHIIASDAHSTDGRPPVLSPGVRAAAKIVGEQEALRMVTDYPQAILEGRRPNVQKPQALR